MITNFNQDPIQKKILHLQDSAWKFYLTGSRYFGNHNVMSDWDFFVQDDPDVRDFLKGCGFQILEKKSKQFIASAPEYYFQGLVSLARFSASGNFEDPNHIDVQLITDAEAKNVIQESMYKHVYTMLDKMDKRNMWEFGWNLHFNITNIKHSDRCPVCGGDCL